MLPCYGDRESVNLWFMDRDGSLGEQAAPAHSSVAQSGSDACRGHLGDIALPCSHSGQATACSSCLGAAIDFKRALMCTESFLRFDPSQGNRLAFVPSSLGLAQSSLAFVRGWGVQGFVEESK